MLEPMCKEGKVMHYLSGNSIRELLEKANSIGVLREDVVQIIPGKDYYYMIYYYGKPD